VARAAEGCLHGGLAGAVLPDCCHALRHQDRDRGTEDLATWPKLNITAFLASAVVGGRPEVIGERYQDCSGNFYLPMFRQPVLVYGAGAEALGSAHGRALDRGLDIAVYIEEMFRTGHDLANRAAVRSVAARRCRWWGLRSTARKTLWTRSSRASAALLIHGAAQRMGPSRCRWGDSWPGTP
jgi:hypothetical protein